MISHAHQLGMVIGILVRLPLAYMMQHGPEHCDLQELRFIFFFLSRLISHALMAQYASMFE